MLAIEDLMIRYHRLKGEETLWLPGTDHAAIATQNVVEKKIWKEENKTRHDLGRAEFLKRVTAFVGQTRQIIRNQMRRIGASVDWSRERYTLDEGLSHCVRLVFKMMYDDGLIYRGYRTVNWCPRCQSTLADDEVEYETVKEKLYWIKYGPFVLATSRPETKLGDTAVAVHPSDKRYKKYVGKKYQIPGVLGPFEVVVVADRAVDPKFGSGVIKVTPAHDLADFEIARRHGIGMRQVIGEDGRMMSNTGKYAGLTTKECREEILKDMRKLGLIEKIEDYEHNLSICYRCGAVIEPLPKLQWFVAVDKPFPLRQTTLGKWQKGEQVTLKQLMSYVVRSGQTEIIPDRFNKTYFHWINNLGDWNISRQIWFGHRVPVYYCKQANPKSEIRNPKCREPLVQLEDISKCPHCHGPKLGRKMSKSLGNGIDPVDMIEKYGADAVRLSLVIGTTPGNDTRLYEEKIAGYRNFTNKLWNISRFILSATEPTRARLAAQTLADRWIMSEFDELKRRVTLHLDNYRLSQAGEELYEFTWTKLADWYLEISKIEKGKDAILRNILDELLVLWHPFAPFVTEHIWQLAHKDRKPPLIVTTWPRREKTKQSKARAEFAVIKSVVTAIRDLRQETGIKTVEQVEIASKRFAKLIRREQKNIEALSRSSCALIARPTLTNVAKRVLPGINIYMTKTTDASSAPKIQQEKDGLGRYILSLKSRLMNQEFISRAPAAVIAKEKERLKEAEEKFRHL